MSFPPSSSASSTSQYTYSAPSTSSSQTNNSYFPTPFHLQQQPYVVSAPAAAAAPPPVVQQAPVYSAAPVGPVYSIPQFQQAHQLFQRDAQTITPEALEGVKAALASSEIEHKAETKKKAVPRKAAGQTWEDPTLAEWPENDYRLFCGDLGNEVNDDVLSKAFSRFPSFNMAKVCCLGAVGFSSIVKGATFSMIYELCGMPLHLVEAERSLSCCSVRLMLCYKADKSYDFCVGFHDAKLFLKL
ncbi:RNA-binding protein 42 [Linum perenne]